MKKILIITVLALLSVSAFAANLHVTITAVNRIRTTAGPMFHNFHETGVNGPTVCIKLEDSDVYTYGDTGARPEERVFLVLDDYHRNLGIFKDWYAILLTAQATGKKLDLNCIDLGVTSSGVRVIRPFYLSIY